MSIDEPQESEQQPLMPDDPRMKEYVVRLLSLSPSEIDRLEEVWAQYERLLETLRSANVALQPEDTRSLVIESMNRAGVRSGRTAMEVEWPGGESAAAD